MCTINFALMLSSKDEVSYWFIYVNMMNIIKSEPYYCELDVLCHLIDVNIIKLYSLLSYIDPKRYS